MLIVFNLETFISGDTGLIFAPNIQTLCQTYCLLFSRWGDTDSFFVGHLERWHVSHFLSLCLSLFVCLSDRLHVCLTFSFHLCNPLFMSSARAQRKCQQLKQSSFVARTMKCPHMLMHFFILEQEDFSSLLPSVLWRLLSVVQMTEWLMQNKNPCISLPFISLTHPFSLPKLTAVHPHPFPFHLSASFLLFLPFCLCSHLFSIFFLPSSNNPSPYLSFTGCRYLYVLLIRRVVTF